MGESPQNRELFQSIIMQDHRALRRVLSDTSAEQLNNPDYVLLGKNGRSLLQWACSYDNATAIEAILERTDVDVNVIGANGCTAIMEAAVLFRPTY